MMQPERVLDLTVAWWRYMLFNDPEAKAKFVGEGCTFCNMGEEFSYGHNSQLQ